ncbi:hypothetical protein [Ktedonospora formicarum]|uniref:Uncharacterized protein n=1 Tax=Ktedonospora formicarum TaxID=2778364 RepID=A0A8J3ICG4_9CHLR|nr:hypothetical protein [Ktedonospora formicarum]GHO51428.1 hypothetical protein KSX_95910 [Ktedonospora formicarum]
MADQQTTAQNTSARISEKDWNDMCDQRDNLDKVIEDALGRKSVRMANIFITDRAHLSASLKKAHNMRERDKLASYRKRLDELKIEVGATDSGSGETASEEGVA